MDALYENKDVMLVLEGAHGVPACYVKWDVIERLYPEHTERLVYEKVWLSVIREPYAWCTRQETVYQLVVHGEMPARCSADDVQRERVVCAVPIYHLPLQDYSITLAK